MRNIDHEECWCLFLNRTNALIAKERMTTGGQDFTLFDKRVIIRRALERKASSVILVHNHPSGSAQPSVQDNELTERVAEACKLFDIRLLDHVIIARGTHFSFRAHNLIR